jgi:hypothetical protein
MKKNNYLFLKKYNYLDYYFIYKLDLFVKILLFDSIYLLSSNIPNIIFNILLFNTFLFNGIL